MTNDPMEPFKPRQAKLTGPRGAKTEEEHADQGKN